MDRNVVLGFVAGVVATCIVGAVWPSGEPAPATAAGKPVARTAAARRAVPPARRPSAATAAASEDTGIGTFEQVVRKIAEYSGDGVIRCEVGRDFPDGAVDGLGRAWVEDGVLVGSVEDPAGEARVRFPEDAMSDPPRAVVKWVGAWPGDTGSCTVLPPKRVLVSGRVVDAAGRPVHEAEVGNLVDGTTPATGDGRFTVLCWQGAECPLAARHTAGEPFGTFVSVVPDKPLQDVVVVLDRPQEQDLEDFLKERVAEDEQLERQPDPIALALADPSIPDETRPVLETWLAEQREGRSVARALLADLVSR